MSYIVTLVYRVKDASAAVELLNNSEGDGIITMDVTEEKDEK